jgi:dTDP-4-amino-4,6-dideoxygalactose transaminase
MTDIQAALGLSQMNRLDEFVESRKFLANKYNELLKDLPLTLPWQHPDTESSWHLYVIRLKLDKINKSHRQVFEELRQAGIGVNLHYIPVHIQPYYQQLGFKEGYFINSESYYQEVFSIPLYYGLEEENQNRVLDSLRECLI